MAQTSFGRRAAAKSPQARPPVMTKITRSNDILSPAQPAADPVDDELRQWKKARGFTFPLKPIALMASLCFGIGSVVLPAQVNDWAQWPLYTLSAASLYVGFHRRKAKA